MYCVQSCYSILKAMDNIVLSMRREGEGKGGEGRGGMRGEGMGGEGMGGEEGRRMGERGEGSEQGGSHFQRNMLQQTLNEAILSQVYVNVT